VLGGQAGGRKPPRGASLCTAESSCSAVWDSVYLRCYLISRHLKYNLAIEFSDNIVETKAMMSLDCLLRGKQTQIVKNLSSSSNFYWVLRIIHKYDETIHSYNFHSSSIHTTFIRFKVGTS
jgi:hypothetical protein